MATFQTRQFGKNEWRVYQTGLKHAKFHTILIGVVKRKSVTKPQVATVYDAYNLRNQRIGRKYTLKQAVTVVERRLGKHDV